MVAATSYTAVSTDEAIIEVVILALSENVQIALIAGLLSGGFAILGALFTELLAGSRTSRQFRVDTALALAANEHLIWEDHWLPLHTHLEEQQTRLAVAGVPGVLGDALFDAAHLCWADRMEGMEIHGAEHAGINTDFLAARRKVLDAIGAHLLRRGSRSSRAALEREAVATVRGLLADPDHQRLVLNRDWRLMADGAVSASAS